MRNFIIFFDEKEGTTAITRLLARFPEIDVVQKEGRGRWEPFNHHACGPMEVSALGRCLEHIYGPRPVDMAALNAVYQRTADGPVRPIQDTRAVGFKMRFTPPRDRPAFVTSSGPLSRFLTRRYRGFQTRFGPFRRAMFDVLRRNDVTVFLAVRQDVLRWALSKYHGDGTGVPGHLQFRVASGRISRADLRPITVDIERLGDLIATCERRHAFKRSLMAGLRRAGVRTEPMLYEDFVERPPRFFQEVLRALGIDRPMAGVERILADGNDLTRIHPHDISEFVTNHEEVLMRFGGRFVPWRPPVRLAAAGRLSPERASTSL